MYVHRHTNMHYKHACVHAQPVQTRSQEIKSLYKTAQVAGLGDGSSAGCCLTGTTAMTHVGHQHTLCTAWHRLQRTACTAPPTRYNPYHTFRL